MFILCLFVLKRGLHSRGARSAVEYFGSVMISAAGRGPRQVHFFQAVSTENITHPSSRTSIASMAKDNADGRPVSQKISLLGGFVAGGIAACGAVTFTNPIELIKTRMQLQGELSALAQKVYKNPFQAASLIFKQEGIRGLQQGLLCGYVYQVGLNGCRIGLYEPSRQYITQALYPRQYNPERSKIPQNLLVNVLAGCVSGSCGAIIANPFFLIKTRMQSYNKSGLATTANVGQQTYYKGLFDGLKTIYVSEGIRGLFRGTDAAVLRTGAGSSAQLPVYNLTKNYLLDHKILLDGSIALHFASSAMAGLGVSIVMNPWDVVLTRLYNQKGNLYKGPVDCFTKTIKAEGPAALYKGFWAQLFRIGPHSILTLMFMEQAMKLVYLVESKL